MIDQAIRAIESSNQLLIELGGELDAHEVTAALNDRDYHAIVIDRAPVFDKDTLMHALYQSLRFPYFGFNWDSLKDVLTGMDGVRHHTFVLTFIDLGNLPEEIRTTFLEVIQEANEVRANHDGLTPLRVLNLKPSVS